MSNADLLFGGNEHKSTIIGTTNGPPSKITESELDSDYPTTRNIRPLGEIYID